MIEVIGIIQGIKDPVIVAGFVTVSFAAYKYFITKEQFEKYKLHTEERIEKCEEQNNKRFEQMNFQLNRIRETYVSREKLADEMRLIDEKLDTMNDKVQQMTIMLKDVINHFINQKKED